VRVSTPYSASFDLVELRFCRRALHTACETAGDARSCPRAADRCTKEYGNPRERRGCGRFRGLQAQWHDPALPTQLLCTQLSSNTSEETSRPTCAVTKVANADGDASRTALGMLPSDDFEKVGAVRTGPANWRCSRSGLLLFGVAQTRLRCRAIHPTAQCANPDSARAHQRANIRLSFVVSHTAHMRHSHHAHISLPQDIEARFYRGDAADSFEPAGRLLFYRHGNGAPALCP
jgi:hypothetical protein